MPSLLVARTLSLTLGLLGLCACSPKVPATLELPPQEPAGRAPARAAEPFDVQVALDDSERLLLAIDVVLARRRPRAVGHLYEEMHSGLPDEGLRSLYYYATQAKFSLELLGLMFDAPVFLAGPHAQHPNLESDDFGRYNPVFVQRVAETAVALAHDPARVERTRPMFERHLRRQARTYALVHRALHDDPAWYADFRADYAAALADPGLDFDRYGEISRLSEAFSSAGMTWYEADTAVYFWLRRDLDGTAKLWRTAVDALLAAYGEAEDLVPPLYMGSLAQRTRARVTMTPCGSTLSHCSTSW
jgi:hypothetical protein